MPDKEVVILGHGDPVWRDYLQTLPTSALEDLREEHAGLVAEPGEETFELIGQILQERKGREA